MDCEFCNVERVTCLQVPTRYGVAAGLCRACYFAHARLHRSGRTRRRPAGSGPARPDTHAGQLMLPLESETSGPAMAARFSVEPSNRQGFVRDEYQSTTPER